MSRPITFKRQADGTYLNTETGVIVKREGKGWRAHRCADTSTGYVGICAPVSFANAKAEGARYVRDVLRPGIAVAYVEAVAEHIDRSEAKAKQVDAPTWRHSSARISSGRGLFELALYDIGRADLITAIGRKRMTETIELAHAEALAEDVRRQEANRTEARSVQSDADGYERGESDVIAAINGLDDTYGDAVRAELQRREEQRERDYEHASEVIAEARVDGPFAFISRGTVRRYLADDVDVLPPEVGSEDVALAALTSDIPDEALAMNAGFDLAHAPAAVAHVYGADFIGNVQRYGGTL
jgi:hypothetical protein